MLAANSSATFKACPKMSWPHLPHTAHSVVLWCFPLSSPLGWGLLGGRGPGHAWHPRLQGDRGPMPADRGCQQQDGASSVTSCSVSPGSTCTGLVGGQGPAHNLGWVTNRPHRPLASRACSNQAGARHSDGSLSPGRKQTGVGGAYLIPPTPTEQAQMFLAPLPSLPIPLPTSLSLDPTPHAGAPCPCPGPQGHLPKV